MPNNNSKKNKRPSPLTVNTSRNVGPTNRRGRERERTRRRNKQSTANNRNIPGNRNRNRNRNRSRSTKKNYRQQLNNVKNATNKKTKIISKNPNSFGLREKLLQRGQMVNVYQRLAAEEAERLAVEEAERLAAEEAERLAAEEEEEEEEPNKFNNNGPVPRFNGPVPRSTSSLFN